MEADVECYVEGVAEQLERILGPDLVGLYLHGSAVLGGFDARRSDVDVIAVCARPMTVAEKQTASATLSQSALSCPVQGLELSIVTAAAAHAPSDSPPFELHMTTAPNDVKVVDGRGHPGDPDLVLHFAMCHATGRPIGHGRSRGEVFDSIPPMMVLNQLIAELQWAQDHAPAEYAVLNACRELRYAHDCAPTKDQQLVSAALDRQAGQNGPHPPELAVRSFLQVVLADLQVVLAELPRRQSR